MKKLYERIVNKNSYLKEKSSLETLPSVDIIGENFAFSEKVKKIQEYYKIKSQPEFFTFNKSDYYSFTSGDPIKYKPFKPAIDKMNEVLNGNNLSPYPQTAGTIEDRTIVAEYCKSLNISKNEDGEELSYQNIVFTASTTHAFSILLELIANPGDVIIVPEPNYGLFDFMPERLGIKIVSIPLKKENDYLINIEELSNLIENINNSIENKNRVIAYLNLNPHNPTGKVMGTKEKELLYELGSCCKKYDMFIIDDMVYRDLTYDISNMALPIATNDYLFDNTITLFGLSKSFGLAGIRGGVVVANKYLIKSMQDKIFHTMDSMSILTIAALTGTFNTNKKRNDYYQSYITELIEEYKIKYLIIKAIVDGIDCVDKKYQKKVKERIMKCVDKNEVDFVLSGVSLINFPENLEPESGFFTILNFTKIREMKYEDNVIQDDIDLFKFLFNKAHTKVIPGSAIMWPYDELVVRLTFAIDDKSIISALILIKKAIEELK